MRCVNCNSLLFLLTKPFSFHWKWHKKYCMYFSGYAGILYTQLKCILLSLWYSIYSFVLLVHTMVCKANATKLNGGNAEYYTKWNRNASTYRETVYMRYSYYIQLVALLSGIIVSIYIMYILYVCSICANLALFPLLPC